MDGRIFHYFNAAFSRVGDTEMLLLGEFLRISLVESRIVLFIVINWLPLCLLSSIRIYSFFGMQKHFLENWKYLFFFHFEGCYSLFVASAWFIASQVFRF